ncbi:rubredoxin [Pseudomonas sp. FYR_11]|uniref:rubredoxin n=1 Tax=Pseudomonas TaxID=286 RepID=UPI00370A2261
MTKRGGEYYCETCWYVYDPVRGDPEHGVEAGTAFEDVPQQWRCPDCGLGKEAFVLQDR